MNESKVNAPPALDEETRSFVRRALSSGLLTIEEIKKVVASLMIESNEFSPQRLAQGLMGAGMLTRWQSDKLLAGMNTGFFLGSYKLLRPLGKGGMGVVYLGEHHVMKRLMALKILPIEATSDPRKVEMFKSEARAAAQLEHANIVAAYDFAEAGNKYFITMEYVDGIDLQAAIVRDGTMSIDQAMDVMIQTATGLAHAHDRGVIHRDIKPSNLLIRTDGVVKISDMGLAKIGFNEADKKNSRRLLGTADFVAPEQVIDSRTVDARSDIYSLGCTLYYLLAGRPPFVADSVAQRLAKHQTTPVPDIRDVRGDCPAAVAELITRMMAKRPEDRPKSAGELLSWLSRIAPQHGLAGNQATANVIPASDTSVEEEVYQATLDDSSLSADGQIEAVQNAKELDFGSLDLAATETLPEYPDPFADSDGSIPQPAPSHNSASVHGKSTTNKNDIKSSSNNSAGNRQLLLGAGLAAAVIMLLGVFGAVGYHFMDSSSPTMPKFKAVPDENGNIVYVEVP